MCFSGVFYMRQSETLGLSWLPRCQDLDFIIETLSAWQSTAQEMVQAPCAQCRLFLGANLPGLVNVYKKRWKITIFNG